MGHGTAWSGRLACTEKNSRVQISGGPPNFMLTDKQKVREVEKKLNGLAVRKEESMPAATPVQESASMNHAANPPAAEPSIMERIFQHLRDGRTLGPLAVLIILLVYALLSPQLPQAFHDYVYNILH